MYIRDVELWDSNLIGVAVRGGLKMTDHRNKTGKWRTSVISK